MKLPTVLAESSAKFLIHVQCLIPLNYNAGVNIPTFLIKMNLIYKL